jgi:branched-chain amino acid transport system substrate-binding protein
MASIYKGDKFMKLMLRIFFVLIFFFGSYINAFAAPFKLGVAGAFEGELSVYGIPAKMAAEIFAAQNTIANESIEIISKNDFCSSQDARSVATAFNTEGIKFILGHTCSNATQEALGIYSSDTMIISATSTMAALTNGDYPNFFRTAQNDTYIAKFISDFTSTILNKENIAIVYNDTTYADKLAYDTRDQIFSSGKGKIKLYRKGEFDTVGNYDYTELIPAIAAVNPDVVICLGADDEFSINVLNRIRLAGVSCDFVADDASKNDSFLNGIGTNTDNVFVISGKDITDAYFAADLISDYKKHFNTEDNPGYGFFQAYSALMALKDAVEKSDSTAFSTVSAALKTEYTNTPIGRIKFSDNGDILSSSIVAYSIYKDRFIEFSDGRLSFEQVKEQTEADCMILSKIEKNRWDAGDDDIIDIKEAITALKVSSGQKTSVIKIGVSPDYPPYANLINGNVVGFDVDIMDAIAQRMGFNYEIVQIQWNKTFPELVNGSIDIEYGGISIYPSRYDLFNYSASYAVENDDYFGFAINKDKTDLRYIINHGLHLIKDDGTYDEIYSRWFGN